MAVFNGTVAAIVDDAQETNNDTGFSSTTGTIAASCSTSSALATTMGFRWANITIPKNSTISAAIVQLYSTAASTDDPALTIYGHKVANSPNFTDTADLVNRAHTTASVSWIAIGVGAGVYVDSPDITAVIQELVNQASWASGNAITIIMVGNGDCVSPKYLVVRAYDTGPGTSPPKIQITYTAPGAGGKPKGGAKIQRFAPKRTYYRYGYGP